MEKKGFKLDFPTYGSNEERIVEILKTKNERLYLAIPILLEEKFDYGKILGKLENKTDFRKLIIITNKILKSEGINSSHLSDIIKRYKLKEKISETEFNYYYGSYKESKNNITESNEGGFREQLKIRAKLNTNMALSNIFSEGKMRIMDKIFNHEKLTNTELKYYYRAIRPLILSILNENMEKYVRIIESNKKYSQ